MTVEVPVNRFQSVCDDYERALEDLDLDVVRTDTDQRGEGRMMMLIGKGEATSAVISIIHKSGAERGHGITGMVRTILSLTGTEWTSPTTTRHPIMPSSRVGVTGWVR